MTRETNGTLRRWGRLVVTVMLLAGFGVSAHPASALQLPPNEKIYVTTFADTPPGSGTCTTLVQPISLRQAIEHATSCSHSSSYVIAIYLKVGTYKLTYGTLVLDNSATVYVNGAHSGATIIDGSGNTAPASVFLVEGYVDTLTGMTITGGTGTAGGGIEDDQTYGLSLVDIVLTHNNAGTSGHGGGLYVFSYYAVTLKYVQILQNAAYEGGGLYVYNADGDQYYPPVVTSTNVNISKNIACGGFDNSTYAPWDNRNLCTSNGYGGGIYDYYGSESITNATIDTNTAGNPAEGTGKGGGIFVHSAGTLAMRLTNVAISGNDGGGYGGAIFDDYDFISGTHVTMTNNYALYFGGGIFNEDYSDSSLSFRDLKLGNNTVGGLYACTKNGTTGVFTCTTPAQAYAATTCPAGNYTCQSYGGEGGGIYNTQGGDASLDYSVIWGNTTAASPTNSNFQGLGGGIYNVGTLQLQSTSLHNNTAYDGGSLWDAPYYATTLQKDTFTANTATDDGGAIYLSANSYAESVDDTQITGNTAGVQTGGLWNGTSQQQFTQSGTTSISGNIAPGSCKNTLHPCT